MVFLYADGGVISIDGDLKGSHNAKATITDFPIESGGFVNDHTVLKPKTFSLSCGVMDKDTPTDMYSRLVELRDKRSLMDIQTSLDLYKSFMIDGIEAVEDAEVGDIVMFSLNFKEVIFAKSKQVKIERKQIKKGKSREKISSVVKRGEVDHKQVTIEKKAVESNTVPESATVSDGSMLYRIMN